jgi:hypothetical protein
MKLHKGTSVVSGRKSPYSLYSYNLATYDKGDTFDPKHSVGFIQLWGLPTRVQAQLQPIAVDSSLKSLQSEAKVKTKKSKKATK